MNFAYEAVDTQGQLVNGVIAANSPREAARVLERKGLTPVTLEVKTAQAGKKVRGALKQQDLILSLYELTTMLGAGVAIADAVASQALASAHPRLNAAYQYMESALRRGEAFSVALAGSKLPIPTYFHQLVTAGEMTGKLAEALRDGVAQMEYEQKISTEMRNALIYPSILVVSGVAAVLLMFLFVVPKFANLVEKAKDLPLLAEIVLRTGAWCNENTLLLGAIIAGIVLSVTAALKRESLRLALLDRLTRVPVLGEWLIEAETARWAKILGALLDNRVPMLQALELAQNGVKLPQRRARLGVVAKAVKSGVALSAALEDNDALTATGYNLVRVGERSGELPKMLGSLATLYEETGRTRMKRVLLLIEPIAILVIGTFIGLIITGIVLAITSANDIVI